MSDERMWWWWGWCVVLDVVLDVVGLVVHSLQVRSVQLMSSAQEEQLSQPVDRPVAERAVNSFRSSSSFCFCSSFGVRFCVYFSCLSVVVEVLGMAAPLAQVQVQEPVQLEHLVGRSLPPVGRRARPLQCQYNRGIDYHQPGTSCNERC